MGRAILSPRKLSLHRPHGTLRLLLTREEIRHPYKLWALPGVLWTVIALSVFQVAWRSINMYLWRLVERPPFYPMWLQAYTTQQYHLVFPYSHASSDATFPLENISKLSLSVVLAVLLGGLWQTALWTLLAAPAILLVTPLEVALTRLGSQGSPQALEEQPPAFSPAPVVGPQASMPMTDLGLVRQANAEEEETDFNLSTGTQEDHRGEGLTRWVPTHVGVAAPPPPAVVLRPTWSSTSTSRGRRTDGRRRPYRGLLDCITTIVAEEGWSTLYRGVLLQMWILWSS